MFTIAVLDHWLQEITISTDIFFLFILFQRNEIKFWELDESKLLHVNMRSLQKKSKEDDDGDDPLNSYQLPIFYPGIFGYGPYNFTPSSFFLECIDCFSFTQAKSSLYLHAFDTPRKMSPHSIPFNINVDRYTKLLTNFSSRIAHESSPIRFLKPTKQTYTEKKSIQIKHCLS